MPPLPPLPPRPRTPRTRRGHLLLAILPLAILVGGFVLLTTATARAWLDEQETRRHQVTALNDANAALHVAYARIYSSGYANDRNLVVEDALDHGEETGFANVAGHPVKVLLVRDRSEVWVSRLAHGWVQLDAVATAAGRRTHVRSLVRERDPFTRFGSFVNSHPLGVGGAPKGDIHANRVVQLFYEDGYYEDHVSARDGFEWLVGATEENTTFAGGYNDFHPEIPMPGFATIEALSQHGDGTLEALLGTRHPADYDIEIELKGGTYDIVAREKEGDEILTSLGNDFPPSGVLFVDADLAGLKGALDARVTLACTGEITLTGSIRYLDGDGDPIYRNGLSNDPANEPYEPNPDYDGNAALGVIAHGDILYDHDVPDVLEMNGFFFSATGRFGLPGLSFTSDGRYATGYDPSFRKTSVRRLGGVATDKRIVSTVVDGNGDVLSGFDHGTSVYDKRLRAEPPPHFLAIDRPLFRGYRIVSGGGLHGGSGEAAAFKLADVPIGSVERAAAGVAP